MVRLKLESEIGLQATVVHSDGTTLATGGYAVAGSRFRAGISPLHAVPLVASGAADALALSIEELAVACRVRSASGPLHRAIISSMLGKAGVPDHLLVGGATAEGGPSPAQTGVAPRNAGTHSGRYGALAGFLTTCHYLGWDCTTSLAPRHPLQRWIRAIVLASYGLPTAKLEPAYPFDLPLAVQASTDQVALTAAMLADPTGARWEGLPSMGAAAAHLRDVILSRPELVTGADSIETTVICATDGAVVAHLAAPNLLWLAVSQAQVGIAVGGQAASPRQVTDGAVSVLAQLELVDSRSVDRLRRRLHLPGSAAGQLQGRLGSQAGSGRWAGGAVSERSVST